MTVMVLNISSSDSEADILRHLPKDEFLLCDILNMGREIMLCDDLRSVKNRRAHSDIFDGHSNIIEHFDLT